MFINETTLLSHTRIKTTIARKTQCTGEKLEKNEIHFRLKKNKQSGGKIFMLA